MSLSKPGPIALRASREALENVGVTEEGGNNRGKWVNIYLKAAHASPGDPWCGAFVAYRLLNAADDLDMTLPADFPLSAWTPDYKEWGKKHGLWIPVDSDERVLPGDLACFYFSAKGRIAHIGIVVERKASGGVYTVEGNTSPETGVDRDGDGVYRKDRNWGEFGFGGGFVRLPF
jgi:hypothetical protein